MTVLDRFKKQESAELQKIEAIEPDLPDVTIERKRGQRTMRLRVSLEGATLSVPSKVSDAEIHTFLSAHKDWLKKHWEVALSKRSRLSEELKKRRGQVLLHGNWKPVSAISVGGRAVSLAEMPEKAVLRTPDGRWNAALLSRALKDLATKELPRQVQRISKNTGIPFSDVTVRAQKSRWGSCSSSGSINLNWRLVKCPDMVRDYVIIHELAHTIEFNHSKAFWDLVHRLMPDYRKALEWISENSLLVFADEPAPLNPSR